MTGSRRTALDIEPAPVIAVSRQEAARACGVEPQTIVRAINVGALPAKRTGRQRVSGSSPNYSLGTGRFLVGVRELEGWLEELDLDAPYVVWDDA